MAWASQVFAGNRERTVMAWEPPKEALEETVLLKGHTGWVRALATCGQWLFSASCSSIRQWDMSRAVPRHKSDVKVAKGDITTLTTGNYSVYACTADGSIQCATSPPCTLGFHWASMVGKNLTEVVTADKMHRLRGTVVMARSVPSSICA